MANETVKVRALQPHSYNGTDYQPGDEYDIDQQFADSVQVQGKAARVDPASGAPSQLSPQTEPKTAEQPKPATDGTHTEAGREARADDQNRKEEEVTTWPQLIP